MHKSKSLRVISFSGIDGAGKSTQIEVLHSWLVGSGLRVTVLSMWDDIVVGPRLREFASLRLFRGDRGVGTPEQPLHRRDKNVTSWPLQFIRLFFYVADAISLGLAIRRLETKKNQDIVIFDRYIYDELANLPLHNALARRFALFLLRFVPAPDAAYIIDADPEAARARKPEYPLEFLRSNRKSYLALAALKPDLIVVQNTSIADAAEKIRSAISTQISAPNLTASSHRDAVTA